MIRFGISITIGAAVLTACASAPLAPGESAGRNQTSSYSARATEGPDLGDIGRFGIPSGRCGMVLYTQNGASPAAIFRSTDDGLALMEVEGTLRDLTLVGRAGDTRQNVPSDQYFRAAASGANQALTVVVQTRWGQPFPAGSYVQDGTLTVTSGDGWSRVVPVAGIAGCKP